MKRTLPLFVFPFLLFFSTIQAQSVPNGNGIVFVKKGGTGDGSSWANAVGELSEAMRDAYFNAAIKEIWVAKGIYEPRYRFDKAYVGDLAHWSGNFERDSTAFRTFYLTKDLKLYGGFSGNENSISERNLLNNPVILEGESSLGAFNANHVVMSVGDAGSAVIDGFEIRRGGNYAERHLAVNNVLVSDIHGSGITVVKSSPTIRNITIRGNHAVNGGGIYLEGSDARLINCTVAGNKADDTGGGIFIKDGNPEFINCTIASNTAAHGGGLHFTTQTSVIRNCIIWNNSSNNILADIRNSLVQDMPADPLNHNTGHADPLFIAQRSPGDAPFIDGDFRTENSTSPVIDKGDNAFYTGLTPDEKDIAGYMRVFRTADGGRIDIGACEFPSPAVRPDANGIVYVKKGAAGDGSSWASALGEPAYAVMVSEKTPEIRELWVAKGTYHPVYPLTPVYTKDQAANTLNRFVFRKNIKLYGGFKGTEQNISERSFTTYDNESVLSGDYNNDDIVTYTINKPVFSNLTENALVLMVVSGLGITNVVLDGFTLTGASWQAIYSSPLDPGGTVQLSNLTVKNNSGGPGSIKLTNTNSIVKNCKFIMNSTVSSGGAGLYFSGTGEHLLMNCLFEKNYAGAGGSAVFLENSICRIINCTMVGNTSASADNAIYTSGTSNHLSIHNSIIIPGYPASGLSRTLIFGDNDFVTTGSILQLDPVDYNTGSTGTWSTNTTDLFGNDYVPGAASAAYESGNTQAWLDAGGTVTDVDLAGKPRIGRNSIDIGAYEYNRKSQLITSSDLSKIYGDAAFAPTAAVNSGLPLQFSSSNPGTAEIFQDAADGNTTKIRIRKAGTVNITVSQPGDVDYDPAPDKIIELTIQPKDLVLEAGNYSRSYGESNPALTIRYNGFITGEGPADIIPPAIATAALPGSAPGEYPVTLTGGSATNYTLKPTNGTLRVTGAVVNLQQQPEDISICEGNTGSISVSANAPSPLVNLQYQWERSADGNTWQAIHGATDHTMNAPNTNGLYRCIITAPGTTITSDAARFTLKTTATPVIEITDKVCIDNGLLALKATPAGGVFSGTGIQNNVWNLEIPAAGQQTIHYSYTDANGCTGETSKTVELQPCHSNSGGISIMSIAAFPNPTSGPVTLRLLVGVEDNWFINVSNIGGKSVQQKLLFLRKGWNTVNLDLTPLPSGTYSIALGRGGRWKQTVKLIKK